MKEGEEINYEARAMQAFIATGLIIIALSALLVPEANRRQDEYLDKLCGDDRSGCITEQEVIVGPFSGGPIISTNYLTVTPESTEYP